MSPPPDWRSSDSYAYLNDLDVPELSWEFLRRNADYQEDYRNTIKPDPNSDDGNDASALHWGLRFRGRSRASFRPSASHLVAAYRSGSRPAERRAELFR
jgi:hypothetical protein